MEDREEDKLEQRRERKVLTCLVKERKKSKLEEKQEKERRLLTR